MAVVVHAYYPDLWRPLLVQLKNLQVPFDLHVTTSSARLAATAARDRPDAVIHVHKNIGRDIAPFQSLVAAGTLDSYGVVLKLHTKRSTHRLDGDAWRTAMWHNLLPSPSRAVRLAHRAQVDPQVGAIAPPGNLLSFDASDPNWHVAEGLGYARACPFPAGSMYWLSAKAVRALQRLPVLHWEEESGAVDGTAAHLYERLVGVVLTDVGLQLLETDQVLARDRRGCRGVR